MRRHGDRKLSLSKSPTQPFSDEVFRAVEQELSRCLRLLLSCLSVAEFPEHLPKLRVVDGFAPLPEQPLQIETCHEIAFYTRGDLNRTVDEILTLLLHRAIHVANAYHWRVDCNHVSYHNQHFRRLAEEVGFTIRRRRSRYGWAETIPTQRLREIFQDLGFREQVLAPFQEPALLMRGRILWHCGLPKLPTREELQAMRTADPNRARNAGPGEIVRGAKVHRLRKADNVVPMLRMSGKWLRRCGFHESTPMRVVASRGQLIIQARDR